MIAPAWLLAVWLLDALLVGLDAWWLPRAGMAVDHAELVSRALLIAAVVLLAALFTAGARWLQPRAPQRAWLYRDTGGVLAWVGAFALFTAAALVLQDLSVSWGRPLIDAALLRIDAGLGFHWNLYHAWVVAHPRWQSLLHLAYGSGQVQLALIPIVLLFARRADDYPEFVVNAVVAGLAAVWIGALLPADSAFVRFGIASHGAAASVSDFAQIRAGQFHRIVLQQAQGLVSMPSYHAALALCMAWALRRVRWIGGLALGWNALMLVSTPSEGGHYLVDVIAGIALGGLTIALTRRWAGRGATRQR